MVDSERVGTGVVWVNPSVESKTLCHELREEGVGVQAFLDVEAAVDDMEVVSKVGADVLNKVRLIVVELDFAVVHPLAVQLRAFADLTPNAKVLFVCPDPNDLQSAICRIVPPQFGVEVVPMNKHSADLPRYTLRVAEEGFEVSTNFLGGTTNSHLQIPYLTRLAS